MNLAYRDVKHNLPRFALTCIGLSLLLGIVITILGIYQGSLDDALRQVRATNPDLWVVEAGTNGPFAEASRISGDTRQMIARVYGVERAGGVTYQSVQTVLRDVPLRLFVIGFEPGRPGGPQKLAAGRGIMRSHYEMIADRSSGLVVGDEVPLGTRGHKFTVVGLIQDEVTASGDPVAYIPLHDAQTLQFELAPPVGRREAARGGPLQTTSTVNAVVAKVSSYVSVPEVVTAVSRWKHLSALTEAQQEMLVTRFVIEKQRRQMGMFTVLLVIVSAVIIALIIYTLTLDKLRAIATLKLIGAPDRTIVGLIVQQALSMGFVGFFAGLALVISFKDYFPRRVVLVPDNIALLFAIVVVVCLLASSLGVRLALKVDPATALGS
jgi:putative ABC transport system permease protein